MTAPDLSLDDLDEWCADLTTAAAPYGVKSVTRDPGTLDLPGVLVQVVGLGVDTLDHGWRVDLDLVLVSPDDDVIRATDSLVSTLNTMRTLLGHPGGDFTPRTFTNDLGQALPALSFPHSVRITQE